MSAPEFPGVNDADTPIFEALVRDQPMTMTDAEAAAMAASPFESWGLDEIAPLPIESMIKELVAQVGEGMAWVIESEAGQEVLNRRLTKNLGEEEFDPDFTVSEDTYGTTEIITLGKEDSDEQPDDGPAGDAAVADGPARPAVVDGDGPDDQDNPGQG